MTDRPTNIKVPQKPKEPPLARSSSYERVVQDIEKWANSTGLQKPK